MENSQEYLTVSALTKYIKFKFDCDVNLRNIMLQGEISGLKHNQNGHLYFRLKDSEATINCMMFSSNASKLDFIPTDGMKVFLKGDVKVYMANGSYSLNVSSMDNNGLGELYKKYEKLKKELEQKGYFDASLKKEIKKFPKVIGVITSPTGAAVKDIIDTIRKRWPIVRVILYPAAVQGEGSKYEIASQIKKANMDALCDTLIVGRGGGSIEDLWAFNEIEVADAIYNSIIPIISGVGHEIDHTIADFVADVCAITPTKAAVLATPDINDIKNEIKNHLKFMYNAVDKKINEYKVIIANKDERLEILSPINKILNNKKELNKNVLKLKSNIENILSYKNLMLKNLDDNLLKRNPYNMILDKRNILKQDMQKLKSNMLNIMSYKELIYENMKDNIIKRNPLDLILNKKRIVSHDKELLDNRIKFILTSKIGEYQNKNVKLMALSPLSIMNRGYSITYLNGKNVKSVEDVKKDNIIEVRLSDGSVKANVVEVLYGEGK